MKNGFDLVQLTSSLKKVGDFARGKLSSEVETLKKEEKKDPYEDLIASQKETLKTLQQGETAIQIILGVTAASMASVVVLKALGF